jgi:hypothetical protein
MCETTATLSVASLLVPLEEGGETWVNESWPPASTRLSSQRR